MESVNDYQVLQAAQVLRLDQYKLPRPCYYVLLLLGLWKPKNIHNMFLQWWFLFTSVIWFAALCNIYVIIILTLPKNIHIGAIINNFTLSLNLSLPYLYSRWFFSKNCYNDVLIKIIGNNKEMHDKLKLWSKLYTLMSLSLGIVFYMFLYLHWSRYVDSDRDYFPIFLLGLVFQVGYWSSWLSVYAYHCHALKIKINQYCHNMKVAMGKSSRSHDEEKLLVSELLCQFHEIRKLLEYSQSSFSVVIASGMIHHIANTVLFSIAYFKDEFGVNLNIYIFLLGLFCDIVSILLKLWPAALVCQALHDVVVTAGEHCNVDFDDVKLPKERFYFYKYLSMYEEDLGVYVLGVKITSQLTVGIFTTILTAGLTLIYYVVPYLKNVPEL